ncbi:MAG: AMIN domain-containing protein [Acidimicrobiia bacterium]|nr:AMIN domain-containing protein [Acidimicrobiia bacterium]
MRSAKAGIVRAVDAIGIVVMVAAAALGARAGALEPVVYAAPLSASALYADATSRDEAVRKGLDDRPTPAMSRAVKSALASYEGLVRNYPTSSYADDALWRAAQLAMHAATRLRKTALQTYADRYLAKLQSAYPSSKYAKQASELRATLSPNGRATEDPDVVARIDGRTKAQPNVEQRGAPVNETTPPKSSSAARSGASGAAVDVVGSNPLSPARLLAIHRIVLPDVVRVTLDIDREVAFRQERLSGPARIFFDLANTTSARSLSDRTVRFEDDGDVVRQIRIGQPVPDTLRVVLDATGVTSCHASPLYAPYRLVVDCVRDSTWASAARTPRPNPLTPGTFARKDVPGTRVPSSSVGDPTSSSGRASADTAPPAPRATGASEPTRATSVAPTSPLMGAAGTGADRESRAPLTTASPLAPRMSPDEPVPTPAPADGTLTPPPARTSATDAARSPTPRSREVTKRDVDGGYSLARQLGLTVSRVVIDPGHGGHDPGAKGLGITEAALVLDVALRLEALLQAEGVEVVLTRRADEFVPLETRTAIANGTEADLFLSIHANASSVPQAGGVETYYLDFANTASAAAVAARENAASGQSMNALPDIVKAIALSGKQAESRDFATHVQRALLQKLSPANKRLRDLGVKQAPFVVLLGASMPSVLAEVSFITNEQEARLLKGQSYRQRIAEALFSAVQRYQESLARASRVTGQ